jgi:hypothetical protein
MDNDNKRLARAALGISQGATITDRPTTIQIVDALKSLAWRRSHEGKEVDPEIYAKLESLRQGATLILRRTGGVEIVRVE